MSVRTATQPRDVPADLSRFLNPRGVAFGLGGVFTELMKDVTHRFAPFEATAAREMITEIKGAPLLQGYRGRPPCDIEALADTLARLSQLIADHCDRIGEIDINPLFVKRIGEGVAAADALVITKSGNEGLQGKA